MSLPPFTPLEAKLEAQCQSLATKYYIAQAEFLDAQRECRRLHTVVQAKQQVIDVLLPYYPHPLTLELRAKIDMV